MLALTRCQRDERRRQRKSYRDRERKGQQLPPFPTERQRDRVREHQQGQVHKADMASASTRPYKAHSADPRRVAAMTSTTVSHTAAAAVSAYDLASTADQSVRGSTVNATAAAHAVGRAATSLPNTTRPAAAAPTATALGSRAVNSLIGTRKPGVHGEVIEAVYRVEVQHQPQDVDLRPVGSGDSGGLVEPE